MHIKKDDLTHPDVINHINQHLSSKHLELKSMKTSVDFVRCGVASMLLTHFIEYAQQNSYHQISLETGSQDYFAPARLFYKKFNFVDCLPFSQYKLDPNSVFMTLRL
ncbi:GNAT family N-acetyltransferase [bacterium]|nr:GNAT family N-acetyltransferase [bacterium]